MPARLNFVRATSLSALLMAGACGGSGSKPPTAPDPPTPPPNPPNQVTANVYIMPDAVKQGNWAFGDEPLVIYKGEIMHWRNLDALTHMIVADTPGAVDFEKTDNLVPGAEQSFTMTRLGQTTIHCTIHPSMTGSIIVREK
jgi:plastocyanin